MNIIYSLLYSIIITTLLPFEYKKRPKSLRNIWIKEKLGYVNSSSIKNDKKNLWIHAVSVGEILAINPLIKKLYTNFNIFLTTITDTGRTVAQKRYNNMVRGVYYLPFDLPPFLKRFIRTVNPNALLIAETEIWPNLIDVASRNMPVILINGRLSERSFYRYLRAKWFFKPYLEKFSLILVQEDRYREYFLKLGVNDDRIAVTGNLKFDLDLEEREFPGLDSLPRPVIIAGSTHDPEETLVAETFLKISHRGTLIIVPRHPERFDAVALKLKTLTFQKATFMKYTELSSSNFEVSPSSDRVILLFDSIGLLGSLYRIADIAIVGGSFIPHGGQNPLEAIFWKKPVITGPYMDNFPFVEEFWRESGILKASEENLGQILHSLLEDKEYARSVSERGYALFQKKRGATEKTLQYLERILA